MTVLLAQLDRDETVAQSLAQEREPLRRHQRVAVEAQPEDPQAMGAAPGQRRPGPDRRNRSCACATGSPEWATTAGTAPVRPPPGRPPWPGRSRRRNRHGHRRRAGSPPAWTIRAQPFAASFFTPDTSAPVSSTTPRNSCPISTRWRSHSRAWATASPGSPSSRPNGSTLLGVVVALTRAKSRAPSWNEASTTEAAPDADSSLTDVRRQRDNLVVLAVDMDPVPDLQHGRRRVHRAALTATGEPSCSGLDRSTVRTWVHSRWNSTGRIAIGSPTCCAPSLSAPGTVKASRSAAVTSGWAFRGWR